MQDVFLKLWMTRETLAEIHNIKAFLLVMARNKTFTELKKIAREKTKQQQWLSENDNMQEQEPGENKFLSLLDLAINHLPPQQQKYLSSVGGIVAKNAEIAAQTGLSLETVKKYLQRAVESITRFLQEHYPMLVDSAYFIMVLKSLCSIASFDTVKKS